MKNPSLSELRQLSERERKRWPRWVIVPIAVVGLAVLWTLFGFFGMPSVVRAQIRKELVRTLGSEVSIERVRTNPFTLTASIEGVVVLPSPGQAPVSGWKRLRLDLDARSLFSAGWHFRTVELDGFTATIAVGIDGRLTSPLMPGGRTLGSKVGGRSRPLSVGRLAITGARLAYRDMSLAQPFATEVGPTTLELRNFQTGGQDQAPGEFRAVTESGETLMWSGVVSVGPLRSQGELRLGNIALRKYAPFYRDRVRFDVLDGRLDLGARYQFELRDGRPFLQLSAGYATIKSLQLARRGERELAVSLKSIEASGVTANSMGGAAIVSRLAITGGVLKARRDAEGIDVLQLLTPVGMEAPRGPATARPARLLPDLRLAEVAVREFDLEFEDLHAQPGLRHVATGLSADARNINLRDLGTEIPFGLRAGLGGESLVSVVGSMALAPLRANLSLELSAYPLVRLNPYLGEWTDLRAADGLATILGSLRVHPDDSGAAAFGFTGDVVVDHFSSPAGAGGEAFVHWQQLALRGLDVGSSPRRLTVADVEWQEPAFHVVIAEDDSLNAAGLFRPLPRLASPAPGPATRLAVQSEDPWYVSIDRLTIENGSVEYVDKSVQPHVRTVAGQLTGGLDGLSSSPLSRASIDVRGKIDGTASVAITGKLNPLTQPAFAEVRTSARQVDLAPFSPYLARHGGYQLAKGTLTLESRVKLAQGKVDCTNTVTLDQFTLGRKVSAPEAAAGQVALATALLRDRAGRIVFNLPVRGNAGDSVVSVGSVFKRLITSALKTASAPFTTLVAAAGGDAGEELGTVRFGAGRSELTPEVQEQLDKVIKGLRERPLVSVEVQGFWDAAADAPMLREYVLETELRKLIWADRKMVIPDLPFAEVQLAPEQKMGMVRRFYYKTFPDEIPQRPIVQSQGPQEVSRPVAGQRGNLGSFERREPAARRAPPPAPQGPSGGIQFQGMSSPLMRAGTVPTGDPNLPEPAAESAAPLSLTEMKERLLALITVGPDQLKALAEARARAVRDYLISAGEISPDRVTNIVPAPASPGRLGPRVRLNLK